MAQPRLCGRVFDRFRAFEKLPGSVQQQVHSVADALARDNVYRTQSTSLLAPTGSVKGDQLLQIVRNTLNDQSAASAESVVDGLVLSGVLAYRKEDAETASIVDSFATHSHAVFVPTDNKLAGRASEHSVWSVRDGATQAGAVKRNARVVGYKDAYAVVNEKLRSLFIFRDDASLKLKAKLDLIGATAEYDAKLVHGIKVSSGKETLVIGLPTREAQETWLHSIVTAGATHGEAFNANVENVASIYELKDRGMDGSVVDMRQYRGRVLLVVNVASKCTLASAHYPELAVLDEKYRGQGLQILAFPCDQFAQQGPGTHEEIQDFAKQYNCTFPLFETRDVNGANARPVFKYLRAQLAGKFVNKAFTKILVDRNGKPFKRYGPKELPFALESDIKTLLAQPVGKEVADAIVQDAINPARDTAQPHAPFAP